MSRYNVHVYALVRVTFRGYEKKYAVDTVESVRISLEEHGLDRLLTERLRDGEIDVQSIEAWGLEPEGNDKKGSDAVAIKMYEPMDDGRLLEVPFDCNPKRATLLRFVDRVADERWVLNRSAEAKAEKAVATLREFVRWAQALLRRKPR